MNSAANATLLENNSSVLTDLAKLGPAGTKFTHDFFLPGTLINFPDQAAGIISKIKDVSSVTGALSLDAIHETGTVPTITATYKTGGQTLKVTSKPPTLTAAQQTAERACIEKLFASSSATRPSNFLEWRPDAGSTGGVRCRWRRRDPVHRHELRVLEMPHALHRRRTNRTSSSQKRRSGRR